MALSVACAFSPHPRPLAGMLPSEDRTFLSTACKQARPAVAQSRRQYQVCHARPRRSSHATASEAAFLHDKPRFRPFPWPGLDHPAGLTIASVRPVPTNRNRAATVKERFKRIRRQTLLLPSKTLLP